MGEDIFTAVKDLLNENASHDEIESKLMKQGYLESDIEDALEKASLQLNLKEADASRQLTKTFALKEILDRVGYGFVSNPFLNILFLMSGASLFIIGIINGIKAFLSLISSSFMKEFSRVHNLRKSFISYAGIVYGFSFLMLAFAVVIQSPLLFSIGFLIGGLGIVAHGEVYGKYVKEHIRQERLGLFLGKITSFGLLITIISMFISGWVLDFFPLAGRMVTLELFGSVYSLHVYGYLISFEITAFAFIISGLALRLLKGGIEPESSSLIRFVPEFVKRINVHGQFFVKNKMVLLLTIASFVTGFVQILGNSYYSIFIYQEFKNQLFGGFVNVAAIFGVSVLFAFIGPWFTRNLRRHIGISPMLVFGTLLSAMLPLSLAFNPNIYVVFVASALSILGAAILGMAHGFFTQKLLTQHEREIYFSFMGVSISIPLLILAPIGAWIAEVFTLALLFKLLIGLLVVVATPLYFAIMLLYERSVGQSLE